MKRAPDESYRCDGYILNSGRGFTANCRIIGIDEEGQVFGGYDQRVTLVDWEVEENVGPHCGFTDEERRELAEHMVARWKAWGGLDDWKIKTGDVVEYVYDSNMHGTVEEVDAGVLMAKVRADDGGFFCVFWRDLKKVRP